MSETTTLPLWRVMADAYWSEPWTKHSAGYATELRALADWLVPEEPIEKPIDTALKGAVMERRAIREILLSEAGRAEAGDA